MIWCVPPQDVPTSDKSVCNNGQSSEMFLGQRDFFPLNMISAGFTAINKAARNSPGTHTIDFQKGEATSQW